MAAPVFNALDGVDVAGKRVLVRVDLNVPLRDGKIGDMTRIERVAPTLAELADKGARVVVMAHFDRPKGKVVPEMSLTPLAGALAQVLGRDVAFAADCVGAGAASVVGGLTSRPIIAVPTSIGYGASFNGLSALLGMLNTCAPGVVVVNIDNGFGAGYFAAMLCRDFK